MAAAILKARNRAAERDHKARAWLAWTTAVLGRVKKIPPLRRLLGGAGGKARPRAQTSDQMAVFAEALAASGLGRLRRRRPDGSLGPYEPET